jgi:malonate decarboxylase delta subunit
MEKLEIEFQPPREPTRRNHKPFAIAGVVGSGNLEVLIEPSELDGRCRILVHTSIRGYDAIWRAVLTDFVQRNRLANVLVSINDGGATPAVVSLRLDQAALDFYGGSAEGELRP